MLNPVVKYVYEGVAVRWFRAGKMEVRSRSCVYLYTYEVHPIHRLFYPWREFFPSPSRLP